MKKALSLLLVIAMLITSLCVTTVFAEEGSDISHMLSGINVNLKGTTDVIKDNVVVGELTAYNSITLTIDWKMEENVYAGAAKAGDYFDISLPYDLFSITNVDKLDLSYNGQVLGTWEITANNPIHFVLSEEGAAKLSLEGQFKFYGKARQYSETSYTLTIGDVVIDLPTIPYNPAARPTEGFSKENGTSWRASTIFTKGGYQAGKGVKQIYWTFSVNYANTSKMLANESYDNLKGAWFEDTFTDDQTFASIKVTTPIKFPHADGTLDSTDVMSYSLTDAFPKIENTMGLSDDEFMEYMKAYGKPGYGVTSDLKRIVVFFGDLAGNGIKYAKDDDDFLKTTLRWANITPEEKAEIINIFGDNSKAGGQVLGYTVGINTNITGAIKKYSNTARFGYGTEGAYHDSTMNNVVITDVSGTISGVDPNAVRLVKKDADTGELLEGATFKLQKKNPSGDFEDYTPPSGISQLTTDNKGEIEFKNLPAGDYRLTETAAADGYDIDSIAFDIPEFTIVSGQQGVLINATNALLLIPPTPPVTEKTYELGWMRSSELSDAKFIKAVGQSGDAWTYEEAFANTPIKYFESEEVRAVANDKASEGTENTTVADEQLVGMEHIWDGGSYFDKYKNENGNVPFDWASWEHQGISGVEGDKGEYSIRRFSAYIDFSEEDLEDAASIMLAPEDELGNMSYLFPINDNAFIFVNGKLAFWGGTDVVAGQNQYGALNRTTFMGKKGINVRNGINGVFKNIYPHTDGWCIDLENNSEAVDIKELLKPGFNRIDIITDEYWEGGGMNQLKLYAKN